MIYYEEILNVLMLKIDLDFFGLFYYALFAVNIKYAGIKIRYDILSIFSH